MNILTLLLQILKQRHPRMRISIKAMMIMNDFVMDMLQKLAHQSAHLKNRSNRKPLGMEDISSAAKLLLPGDQAKFAIINANSAITKFTESK